MLVQINYLPQDKRGASGRLVAQILDYLEASPLAPCLLAQLRVHFDWLQYQHNFREPVMVRRLVDERGQLLPAAEIAVDVRRAGPATFAEELAQALTLAFAENPDRRDQVALEEFGPIRSSVIWRFNRLFWQHLAAWEEVTGREYEAALPGGRSDAHQTAAIHDDVESFWLLLQRLEEQKQLPEEIFALEIGVGTGTRARLWLDRFRELDAARAGGYYPRLRLLLSDYSMPILDRALAAVQDHHEIVSAVPLDALNPFKTLSFLRYKILHVHLTNVYDNLPGDELVRRDGRYYLVEARAFVRQPDAVRLSQTFEIPLDDLSRTVVRLLEIGPDYFADRRRGVGFWQAVWEAVRLEERLVRLEDLGAAPLPACLVPTQLEEALRRAPDDLRFHLSTGALESFSHTVRLLHPQAQLQVHDIFVTNLDEYRQGFRGPGKMHGTVVNWVNGALLREVGHRAGYDVHFAPYRYRAGSLTSILYTTERA